MSSDIGLKKITCQALLVTPKAFDPQPRSDDDDDDDGGVPAGGWQQGVEGISVRLSLAAWSTRLRRASHVGGQ